MATLSRHARATRWRLRLALLWAAIALPIAPPPAHAAAAPTGAQTPAPAPVTLKVMSFNIWYGGEQVDFAQIVEEIRLAGADIVGIQEPDGFLDKLAEATGLVYTDHRRNIISRYPLFDSGVGERTDPSPGPYGTVALDADALHAWVMVRPGKVVAMANTHLTSDPYGPDVAASMTPAALMAFEERLRGRDARPFAALAKLAAAGVPVFMTGDFNSPSPLDWTPAAAAARHLPYPFAWPAAGALLAAGLRDSYREVHPDPLVNPTYTWTAGMPAPYVRPEEKFDRIDYVFTAGPTRTLASQIIGEAGGTGVDLGLSPYPSDHRAVVSSFAVTPVDAPPLVVVSPHRVVLGETFMMRMFLPGATHFTALVVPRGAGPEAALSGVVDETRGFRTGIRLATEGFKPGGYDAILLGADGKVAARNRFEVVSPDTKPMLTVTTPVIALGDKLGVRWSGMPGNRLDYVGIFHAGDPSAIGNLLNYYTDARLDGAGSITLVAEDKPLPPGEYEARLLRDDSFVVLARARFTIQAR